MPSPPYPVEPNDDEYHEIHNDSQPKGEVRLYIPSTKERLSYNYFLDLLDFKPATPKREEFKLLLTKYHDKPRRRYLRKTDGDKFSALVDGFLKKHGSRYFGACHRAHLVMSDPAVGLHYHSDGETEESHLRKTLADFFHWRSYCVIGGRKLNKRPASSDDASSSGANEDNVAQRPRRHPEPERESQPGPSVTNDKARGHAHIPLKRRRGRPRIRSESSDGHRSEPLRAEGQGQGHAKRPERHRRESPPSRRSDVDRRHPDRNLNVTGSARSSESTIHPEAPGNPPRRISQPTVVDISSSEGETIKSEPLDATVLSNTTLLVRVSNQPNVAPVFVNLRLCRDIETLFPLLIAECDVQAPSAMKVTKISVTFPWNREELRLRRGRREDWVVFRGMLRQRWQHSEVADEGTCKVEMLVHVDV